MSKLTVIDIFCGAGGFSEGFRQAGFEILLGVDRWQPAIDTFNHNFRLECVTRDVVELSSSIESIESLPDTAVILGSPPCVSFSSSNLSGKADKSVGIELTEAFLRIVAVKKFKPGSILCAWFMENVPRSIKYLKPEYSFRTLNLAEWAQSNHIDPDAVAIKLESNRSVINSADYGSPQTRLRAFTGEILPNGWTLPAPTHSDERLLGTKDWVTIADTIRRLPKPHTKPTGKIQDPNYKGLTISASDLTDHFYDTGLYRCEWELSRHLKTNHPYMGKMSFPENEERPSRTVTATKIGSSREALIYRSENRRVGDGEYRTPTVREAACLMSFPITYQFKGSEGTKWRLVGNAVCPAVSRVFANEVRRSLGLSMIAEPVCRRTVNRKNLINLNGYEDKEFKTPPKRNKNSRFRRHPFKYGNMTVTLSNYDIEKNGHAFTRWLTSVQYGTGSGFPTYIVEDRRYLDIEPLIKNFNFGEDFMRTVERDLVSKTAPANVLQKIYDNRSSENGYLDPSLLVDRVAAIIESLTIETSEFEQNGTKFFADRESVPVKQLLALYAINRISTHINERSKPTHADHPKT